MGFPRKADMGLYFERKDKSYLLVLFADGSNGRGQFDAVGNVMAGDRPNLAGTQADRNYLHDRCKRVEWADMPKQWQDAFVRYMNHPHCEPFDPMKERGLHKLKTLTPA